MKDDLHCLEDLDAEVATQLVDSAYQYLLDKKSMPIKKLSNTVKVPFSAIYSFLRLNPATSMKLLEKLNVDAKVTNALKAKIYLMYA